VDEVGRWGGDELLVVLRQVDAAELAVSAETLRSLVASSHVLIEEEILQGRFRQGQPSSVLMRIRRQRSSGRMNCCTAASKAGGNRVSVGL
jgi:GGDEF domain-containing protein